MLNQALVNEELVSWAALVGDNFCHVMVTGEKAWGNGESSSYD